MRAFITGVAGQDGTLLSEASLAKGWEVFGGKLESETLPGAHPLAFEQVKNVDITDYESVNATLSAVKPDVVFHLAGISSVGFSIENPDLTMKTNVGGTENVLRAVENLDSDTHLINAASTEIYAESDLPITEESRLGPRNPYAESKAKTVELVQAARQRGLKASNAILSNHESPLRGVEFVTGKIANSVARIYCGLDTKLILGNIDVEKNWSAAKDIVEGIIKIAETNFVGDVILANQSSTKLTELIAVAFESVNISDWENYVESDSQHKRIGDVKSVQIDPGRAFTELDWRATTPVSEWMGEMVMYHVEQLKHNAKN